jgi:hypothetical protein
VVNSAEKKRTVSGKKKNRKRMESKWKPETGKRNPESFPGLAGMTAVKVGVMFHQNFKKAGEHFAP